MDFTWLEIEICISLKKDRCVDQKISQYLEWPPFASCSVTHLLCIELIRPISYMWNCKCDFTWSFFLCVLAVHMFYLLSMLWLVHREDNILVDRQEDTLLKLRYHISEPRSVGPLSVCLQPWAHHNISYTLQYRIFIFLATTTCQEASAFNPGLIIG